MKVITFVVTLLAALSALLVFPLRQAYATQAALNCTPATGTYNVGDTISVQYVLNTRNYQTFGAEVVATYDSDLLEPAATQSTPVTAATNWSAPTTNTIDATLGKIVLDYGNAQPVFTGSGTIGTVSFKAKAEGQAQFNFAFYQEFDNTTPGVAKVWGKKDGTNLSNILTDVTNCIYVIASQSAPTPTTAPGIPTPTQPAPTSPPVISQLPRTGTVENVILLVTGALMLIIVGAMVPAFIKQDD